MLVHLKRLVGNIFFGLLFKINVLLSFCKDFPSQLANFLYSSDEKNFIPFVIIFDIGQIW